MLRRILICASFAAASLRAEPLRVVTPADSTTLRGGHFVTLSWSAQQLPRGAEEWEAFLSLDGGRYYPVRLTPHLDIGIRSFQVLIPNVDSEDVRLLVRTGNERKETIIELPQRLRIRAEVQAIATSEAVHGRGEAARPNEPPVVQWSVGDRVESSAVPASLRSSRTQNAHSTEIAPTTIRLRHENGGQAILPVRTDKIVCPPLRNGDVLLQTSRLNV